MNGQKLIGDLLATHQEMVFKLKRKRLLKRIKKLLHRPWNPITRRFGMSYQIDMKREFIGGDNWQADVKMALEKLPNDFFTGYSLSPDTGAWLYNVVTTGKINCMLELGCGVSTIIIGLANLKRGGDIAFISLESDKHWMDKTKRALEMVELKGMVDIYHAPLGDQVIKGQQMRIHHFNDFKKNSPDLFFIDAPTLDVGRGGAIPYFHEFIDPEAIIIMDDAERESEYNALISWSNQGLISLCGYLPLGQGIAVMKANKNQV